MSRSLFFYVKHQHVAVVPGIKEFIAEFETLSESNKKAVLEKSRIANQILATNSRAD